METHTAISAYGCGTQRRASVRERSKHISLLGWRNSTAIACLLSVMFVGAAAPRAAGDILQVTGTASGATITGTMDTSGYGTNQLDVHIPAALGQVSPVWFTFTATRPLLWYGAQHEPGTYNYLDMMPASYDGYIMTYGAGWFHVVTSGTHLSYSLTDFDPLEETSDIISLESYWAWWGYYPFESDRKAEDTACLGMATFETESGYTIEEPTYEFLLLSDYYLIEGTGALTEASIVEIEPDVWRFTWQAQAALTPEPASLVMGLLALTTLRRRS